MIVVYPDRTEIIDFVVPTVEEALAIVAEGAINGCDLLEQAGLSHDDATAELTRLERGAS